ncbi:MAG TPA: hypothetical protein VH496_07980 [Mycobacterium sp.]
MRIHTLVKKVAITLGSAAVATPAMLFLGAGPAQAEPDVGVWSVTPGPAGWIVEIMNFAKAEKNCTYTATPVGALLPPFRSLPFHLGPRGVPGAEATASIYVPGIPTGAKWIPSVICDIGNGDTDWPGKPAPIVDNVASRLH